MRIERVAPGPGRGRREEEGAAEVRLVRAAAAGSREALGQLFHRYAEDVYRVAYRICGTRADAEDTLQDVFVGLPRALAHYEEKGRFGGWLRQVAVRTALSRMRAVRRRPWEPLDVVELPARASGADVVDRMELSRVLGQMPEAHRIVFLLKEVEGYDHAEIGAFLSISPGASRVRLHRAWRFLETRLRDQPEAPPPEEDP